jgi:hypothetical protein
VRAGVDEKRRKREDDPGHTLIAVYTEMLLQVCRDYPGLPDPRTLTMTEIRFFYEGLRPELRKHTAPQPTAPSPRAKR